MPYDPMAPTEDDRNFAMTMMWLGLATALLLLVAKLFGFFEPVRILAGGFAAGSLIGIVYTGRHDEYVQGIVHAASRWATAVAGLWLCAAIMPISKDSVADPVLVLVTIAATFHITFAIVRLRGNFDV